MTLAVGKAKAVLQVPVLHGRVEKGREAGRLNVDVLPRTSTSTSTQLLSSVLECCFTSTKTVGLSGTGAQDVHHDFHTAPEL